MHVDGRTGQLNELPSANLRTLSQLQHAVHRHVARRYQHFAFRATPCNAEHLKQVVQFNKFVAQREMLHLNWLIFHGVKYCTS